MNDDLRKDIGWALLIGAVLAASPETGAARPLVSVVLGGVAALGIFAARRLTRRFLPDFFEAGRTGPTRVALRPWHGLLFAALTAVFTPTLVWLWDQYTFSIWRNAHGLFLPVIVIAMIHSRLRALPPGEARSSAVGAVLIALGAALAVVDAGVRSGYVGTIGLILCAPGLSLLLLGPERTRALALPLALVAFIMPMPEHLPDPAWLATGTSVTMEHMLDWVGIPTLRHQTYFILPAGRFNVSTNCGGHAFFYASILLAILLANQTSSRGRRIALLLATWPMTVFVNGIRGSVLIGLTNHYGPAITESFLHGLSGILTFWGVMAGMLLLADWPRLLRRPLP